MAGGGERERLGDIDGDAELRAVSECLADAVGVGLNHRLQPRAARPLWLLRRAPRRHVGEAVHHVRHQARAVRRGSRRRVRRRRQTEQHAQERECEESCHFGMSERLGRERMAVEWGCI